MPQPREPPDDSGEDQRRTVAILNVGTMDHGMDEMTLGVG